MERKIINLWCRRCRQDWHILADRHWKNSVFPDVWEAPCPTCGTEMIRLVNDARNDVYYRFSKQVKLERRKFADDILQMGDPRFDLLYPQHKKEREEKARQLEIEKFNEKNRNLHNI